MWLPHLPPKYNRGPASRRADKGAAEGRAGEEAPRRKGKRKGRGEGAGHRGAGPLPPTQPPSSHCARERGPSSCARQPYNPLGLPMAPPRRRAPTAEGAAQGSVLERQESLSAEPRAWWGPQHRQRPGGRAPNFENGRRAPWPRWLKVADAHRMWAHGAQSAGSEPCPALQPHMQGPLRFLSTYHVRVNAVPQSPHRPPHPPSVQVRHWDQEPTQGHPGSHLHIPLTLQLSVQGPTPHEAPRDSPR